VKSGLECQHLFFSRSDGPAGERFVLEDIHAHFEAGCLTLITGKTGAGKTTLLHLLAALMRPTQGRILADGQCISRWVSRHRDLWRRQVGIGFQQPYLFGSLTVLQNTLLPLVPLNSRLSHLARRAADILARLDLTPAADKRVSLISAGERQRVGLARALINRPAFLLVDEPTAFQDDGHAKLIVDLLAEARDGGAAVVVCSHDGRIRRSECAQKIFDLRHGHLEGA
jgi:ABC-type lipoprotein export system ATPase subunit